VLDEVTHVTEANECLLDHELVILKLLVTVSRVVGRVVPLELELVDRLSNDLLKSGEKAEVKEFLGVLWAVHEVGLDEQVAESVQSH